jgi:aromatic ring-opening dioxygenase LigB subunit
MIEFSTLEFIAYTSVCIFFGCIIPIRFEKKRKNK